MMPSRFVSGYRFSDTINSSKSDAPLGAGHRRPETRQAASLPEIRKRKSGITPLRPSISRMDVLPVRDDSALPPLLAHAVEVMHRPYAVTQRMGIRDRGRDIHFGEKNRFRQSATMRQVAGQGRGERASGAMR